MTTPEPTWTVEQACAALAAWNEAQERARDEYRRDPFAASRPLAINKLKHDHQYGLIDFDEYRDGLAEIRRW